MTGVCTDTPCGGGGDNNCRTCSGGGGVQLFGVQLTAEGSIMKKSASMGDLLRESPSCLDLNHVADGYHSDTPAHATNRRKKAIAWTEKEHQLFLKGLLKLGKGDWRGISKKYVVSRTPTQVASHAQKYYFRHSDSNRRKKRASLFDIIPDPTIVEEPLATEGQSPISPQVQETDNTESLTSLSLSCDPIKSTHKKASSVSQQNVQRSSNIPPLAPKSQQSVQPSNSIPPLAPPFFYTGYYPVAVPFWPQIAVPPEEKWFHHQVLKPIPYRPIQHFNEDGLAGLAHLGLEKPGHAYNGNFSSAFNSRGDSQQSAFRTNTRGSESARQAENQFESGKANLFFI